MSEFRVEFTPFAEADFDAILEFIAADNPIRALSFVDELREASVRFLSTTPNAGTRVGMLRFFVKRKYVVIYRVDEPQLLVEVLMVTEGHRNWRRLLDDLQ